MLILKRTHSLYKIPSEEKRHYFYAAIIQCISQSWKHICSKLLRKKMLSSSESIHQNSLCGIFYEVGQHMSKTKLLLLLLTKLYSAYLKRQYTIHITH